MAGTKDHLDEITKWFDFLDYEALAQTREWQIAAYKALTGRATRKSELFRQLYGGEEIKEITFDDLQRGWDRITNTRGPLNLVIYDDFYGVPAPKLLHSPDYVSPQPVIPGWKHPIPTTAVRVGNTPSQQARLKARAKRKKK